MNDRDMLKQGLSKRIQVLNAKALICEVQKDFIGALDFNQRKIELLFQLGKLIMDQADQVLK